MPAPHNRLLNNNKLKLGLFAANCSGGMSVTKVPERWDASWESNKRLAELADEVGLEFLLPIARWITYGGETDFHGHVLETLTWATGMLTATKGISVFGTTHTAFFHPIVAAKQFATIDHISNGRFGVNVVCGWNKPEYDMFNIQMPDEHRVRYGLGQEWFDIVRELWDNNKPFDFKGEFFQLSDIQGLPKPKYGRLLAMNAGSSDEGKAFAVKNVDFLFTILIDLESGKDIVAAVKQQGKDAGRDLGVFTASHVVCRENQKEAEDYWEYYSNEMADWPAVDNLMRLQGMHAKSFPAEAFGMLRQRFAAGHGTYPLVGTPDRIADELEKMSDIGLTGTTLSFVNYVDELPYFAQEVLPRLEKKGLREPYSHA